MIYKHYQFAKHYIKGQFNKTMVKKHNEKCMIPGGEAIKITYIIPLVSIDGLLYLTNERVYMQPSHPQLLGESVINIKLSKIK